MLKGHEFYMNIALEIAKRGLGRTNPNPLVGCVIVKDDKILATGYHERIGESHAEINAIKNLNENKLDAIGATLYVNLEPCSHYGKTPPCANVVANLGLKKVVVGMLDPNPLVNGKGIKILRDKGIEVITGVLEDECKKLNEIFINYITNKRPFVVLKQAMTLDGKIATYKGDSKWITCEKSRQYVHKLRDRLASIVVGINTVLKDDPLLSVRHVEKRGNDCIKIVVDSKGRLPLDCNLIKNMTFDNEVILATTSKIDESRKNEYIKRGVYVLCLDGENGRVDLNLLMDELYKLNIDSVLLEGGGTLNASFLENKLVSKVVFFISPKIIGGINAKTPVLGKGIELMKDAINLKNVNVSMIDSDIMIEGVL